MIFFFYGPNTYMLRQKLRQMTATYVEKSGSDFGLERIDGAAVTAEKLRANLQASPFLANSRLVIIENLGKNKAVNAKIQQIISDVPTTTVAVFVETEPDARTTYYKYMLKLTKPVFFEALPQAKLISWAKSEIERFGGTAERDAINLLLDMTNGDQWRLSEEIQKVVNYNVKVTSANVTLLVEAGLDQNVFDLVDAMTGGREGEALRIYQRLLAAREDEFKILGMIEWQLRNLLLAKAAGQIPSAELAKVAGMSPYAAGKMQTASRRYDIEILKTAFKNAVDTEDAMKKGITPSAVAVELLIYRVSTLTKSPTRSA